MRGQAWPQGGCHEGGNVILSSTSELFSSFWMFLRSITGFFTLLVILEIKMSLSAYWSFPCHQDQD